jgi:Transposase DDE domain
MHRSATGRILRIRPHDALQRAARRDARNPEWQNEYRRYRPMVEQAIARLLRDNRKVRYRGVAKNDHWLHHRAAALNLRRLTNLGLVFKGTTWAASGPDPRADAGVDYAALAQALVDAGATTKPATVVASILSAHAEGTALNRIASDTGVHHKTVSKIIDAAENHRQRLRVAV